VSQPIVTGICHDLAGGAEQIYMTGDLGRMLPDGFMIHLGRKDHMVKIEAIV
jgi:non-ribosomal peptide synthetase component F